MYRNFVNKSFLIVKNTKCFQIFSQPPPKNKHTLVKSSNKNKRNLLASNPEYHYLKLNYPDTFYYLIDISLDNLS